MNALEHIKANRNEEMKTKHDKIVAILRQYELNVLEYTDGDLTSGQLYKLCESNASAIEELYEQEAKERYDMAQMYLNTSEKYLSTKGFNRKAHQDKALLIASGLTEKH